MGWFSSKKCETNIYIISEKVNEKVKFNFIFYSLDEGLKNDYEFLKKIRFKRKIKNTCLGKIQSEAVV